MINVQASCAGLPPGALAAPGDGGGGEAGKGAAAARHAALHAPSIEIGPSGTLKLFKSLQAFEFNPAGMLAQRQGQGAETAPLARGAAAAMQTSYKVRPLACQPVAALQPTCGLLLASAGA